MVKTRQPIARSFLRFCLSRATLYSNLGSQKLNLDFGMTYWRQFLCRCQKQPCTKIAFLCGPNDRSGCPGSFRTCKRYLYPNDQASFL